MTTVSTMFPSSIRGLETLADTKSRWKCRNPMQANRPGYHTPITARLNHGLEDEDDHSDESTAAVAVSVGDEIPFSLHDVEDVDWFKFDAQAGQSYVVSVLGSELSVRLEIQDDNRQVLASGRDYEVSRSRIVYDALTTGERFIKVTPFHRFGTYTLSLNHNEDGESDAVTEITMGEIIESKGLLKFKATEDEVYEIYFLDPAHKSQAGAIHT